MANDPFYGTPLGRALIETNGVYGKVASQPSSLYMTESNDTRRFTVVDGKISASQHIKTVARAATQADVNKLRDYLMNDMIAARLLRTDTLPPRRSSIVEMNVRAICANWR